MCPPRRAEDACEATPSAYAARVSLGKKWFGSREPARFELGPGLIAQVDGLSEDAWNQILAGFADASVYQTWAYGAVRWGESQLSHLVLRRDGVAVAAAQLRVLRVPVLGLGIAYAPWAPLWRRRGAPSLPEHFTLALQALDFEYARRRGLLLRVLPRAGGSEARELHPLLAGASYRPSAFDSPYRTFVVDLERSPDELRASLAPSARRHLKRAERARLRTAPGSDVDAYRVFLALYREMHARKRFEERVDAGEFERIQQRLPEGAKLRIWIAYEAATPIAASVISKLGDTAVYLLGASSPRGRVLRAAYAVHWNALLELRSEGFRGYDLGGVGSDPREGTYRFKHGFAGRVADPVSHLGAFDVVASRTASLVARPLGWFIRARR